MSLLIRFLRACYHPVKANLCFFAFMYVLGVLSFMGNGFGKHAAVFELFLDVYVVCLLLCLLPRRVRRWVRGLLYVVFYGLSLIQAATLSQIDTRITPALLQDVLQTTQREATEALSTYFSWRVLLSPFSLVLLLMVAQVVLAVRRWRWRGPRLRAEWAGLACVLLLGFSVWSSWVNKKFLYYNIVKVDNSLDEQYYHQMEYNTGLYLPIWRLLHAAKAVKIARDEVATLERRAYDVRIDSCSFRSPYVVLIIGESYNRHHSQLYGYDKPTTPRQVAMACDSSLVAFTDVIAPYHQTSEVFKLAFSLYAYGEKGSWQDYPLFTQLFKKAGYRVDFVTNQLVQSPTLSIWDYFGSTFLNNETLSQSQFSHRNRYIRDYDEQIIADYDSLRREGPAAKGNLVIFHLLGQHVSYDRRYPQGFDRFHPSDYQRSDLSPDDLHELASYDNATLYNDYVVGRMVDLFRDKEAVVVYMPDHGELCFDGGSRDFGRSVEVTTRSQVWQQFEIPFWIWASPSYRQHHADICGQIRAACNQPFMTDNIDQLLLYLAGISCRDYRAADNPLDPRYDAGRRRMMMGTMDYDRIIRRQRR